MSIATQPLKSLDGATSTGAGSAFGAQGMSDVSVQVVGISGGSINIEASNDGTNWVTQGSAITTDGITILTPGPRYFRANLTAGSGPTTAIFNGV